MSHPHRTRPPRRDPDAATTGRGGQKKVGGDRKAAAFVAPEPQEAPKRRAQANLQPPTASRGNDVVAAALFRALEVAADEDAYGSPFPHGFHSWPAGLHPAIARVVMDEILPHTGPGLVVDPFAGGGTVGLEALLHRRPFLGTDLNPLSRLVGGERCRPRNRVEAGAVLEAALVVTDASKARVRDKVPARAPVSPEVASRYLPHTLMELAGLLEEISGINDVPVDGKTLGVRRTLAVCFSSILTKVSQRRGDTDDGRATREGDPGKRVGRFVPSEQFFAKVQDLLERQVALFEAIDSPPGAAARAGEEIRFLTDDARSLPRLLGKERAKLVVTSPPYGGTYNYTDHHSHRLAFLGLDAGAFERDELFPRRLQHDGRAFDDGTRAMLKTLASILHMDGLAVVVVGDAEVAGERVDAARHIEALAGPAGLEVVAVASAPRPDFLRQRGGGRMEHLVALATRV